MILSRIPSEVLINHLFPFLPLNDLLRLRRVSKFSKVLSEDYLRLHGTKSSYIPLAFNSDDENVSSFMSAEIFLSKYKFSFAIQTNKVLEQDAMQQFANEYGSKVTHLCFVMLEIPFTSKKVVTFFEKFVNLDHLQINSLTAENSDSSLEAVMLPSTFQGLKSLQIDHYFGNAQDTTTYQAFIKHCSSNLVYMQQPYTDDDSFANLPGGRFHLASTVLETQLSRENIQLEWYDLGRFEEKGANYPSSRDFYELLNLCSNHKIKLLNVDANLIEGLLRLETWDKEYHRQKLSSVIASLHYLHRSSFSLELPHLEKIFISEEYGTSENCSMPHMQFDRKTWANLRELEIWVDSAFICMNGEWPPVLTSQLLDFFFVNIKREKMEILKMHFYPHFYHQDEIIPHPQVQNIYMTCPNLKYLELGSWPGESGQVAKLWENLPLLETIKFENCKSLANDAFIGEDKTKPSFLKLTNLKSLELDGLEKMPKITDDLLKDVIKLMPLKRLILCSAAPVPVKSISVKGIKSLLGGDFAKHVEQFQLVGKLQLESVTEDELKQVEGKFRSALM